MCSHDDMPFDDCVDEVTPLGVLLSAKFKKSFAYKTVKDRLPVILTQVVDRLSRNKITIVNEYGEIAREELKLIIGSFSKLRNELQTNKPLLLLTSRGKDVKLWNSYHKTSSEVEGDIPRWYKSPWLYVECYMYRRIHEAFELSTCLNSYDPFKEQKEIALTNSMAAIVMLSSYVRKTLAETAVQVDLKREFLNFLYVNLWGNRCDLSISAGGEIIMDEDPLDKLNQFRNYLLNDNSELVWNVLDVHKDEANTIIDIVMDNAGYELYTDLCLADFIIRFSLAKQIRFRVKVIPWYISDTCVPDFQWTLRTLRESENPDISNLASQWQVYINSGKWTLHADEFWTLPHVYNQMQTVDPELYNNLSEAALVIFKGDLNYRKLVGDRNWDPTTPFSSALCGFSPTNIVALRTLKADVICGLQPGQAEEVAAKDSDWLVSGQYAVIQYNRILS